MTARPDIELVPPNLYDALVELPPFERAKAAADAMDACRAAMGMLAVVRRKALQRLVDEGASVAEVAAKLQITRQQVHRLIKGEDARPRYLVERGPNGTWVVTSSTDYSASKYPTKERAIEVAQMWAKRTGGLTLVSDEVGAPRELPPLLA